MEVMKVERRVTQFGSVFKFTSRSVILDLILPLPFEFWKGERERVE